MPTDLTTSNPITTLLTDSRWQLDWTFATPVEVQAGVTRTLVFQAGALVATGNYSSEGYAFYQGHGVSVHKDSTITGDIIGAISKVKIHKNTAVNGNVRAGGKIDLKKDVTVQFDVIGAADIKLDKDVSVTGDVTAEGDVTLGQGASVTGTVLSQASGLTIVPADLLIPSTLAADGQDIEVAKNGSMSLSPGSYGELRLKQNSTLDLVAGQYAFEKVTLDKDSNIDLDLTNGAITSQAGSASDIKFRAQSSIDLHKDSDLVGAYLSLGGKKESAITWPSATVRVMDVFQVTTTNANGEIGSSKAWVGLDSGLINRPIVGR